MASFNFRLPPSAPAPPTPPPAVPTQPGSINHVQLALNRLPEQFRSGDAQ